MIGCLTVYLKLSYTVIEYGGFGTVMYATIATLNGTTTCQPVYIDSIMAGYGVYTLHGDGSFPLNFDGLSIPDSYLSSIGLHFPPGCNQSYFGEPTAQVPVQYLTSTQTINNIPEVSVKGSTSPGPPQTPSPGFVVSSATPSATANPTQTTQVAASGPSRNPNSNTNTRNPSTKSSAQFQAGSSPQSTKANLASPTTISIDSIPFLISGSQVLVGTQTLFPGGTVIMYSNTPISLGPSASAVVIGTDTFSLAPNNGPAKTIQLGGTVYTQNTASDFIIGSQTLVPGGVITVAGVTASLASGGTAIVEGQTLTLGVSAEVTASSQPAIGGAIWSAFNPGGSNGNASTTAGSVVITGVAHKTVISKRGWLILAFVRLLWEYIY
jgi:hypothetical protein